MKTLILGTLAATLALGPVAMTAAQAAPQGRTFTTSVRERPNGTVVERTTVRRPAPAWRTWHRGERFDRRHAQGYRLISDWRAYRLAPPPRGHVWYRSGRDAVLVRNGTVVTIRGGIF